MRYHRASELPESTRCQDCSKPSEIGYHSCKLNTNDLHDIHDVPAVHAAQNRKYLSEIVPMIISGSRMDVCDKCVTCPMRNNEYLFSERNTLTKFSSCIFCWNKISYVFPGASYLVTRHDQLDTLEMKIHSDKENDELRSLQDEFITTKICLGKTKSELTSTKSELASIKEELALVKADSISAQAELQKISTKMEPRQFLFDLINKDVPENVKAIVDPYGYFNIVSMFRAIWNKDIEIDHLTKFIDTHIPKLTVYDLPVEHSICHRTITDSKLITQLDIFAEKDLSRVYSKMITEIPKLMHHTYPIDPETKISVVIKVQED
jgi:hypothetical protein